MVDDYNLITPKFFHESSEDDGKRSIFTYPDTLEEFDEKLLDYFDGVRSEKVYLTKKTFEYRYIYPSHFTEADKLTFLQKQEIVGRSNLFYLVVDLIGRDTGLGDFCRSYGEVPGYNWTYERCKEIEEHRDFYLDLWSRDHLKTTLITLGMTVQDILNMPELVVGLITYDVERSRDMLKKIQLALNDFLLAKGYYKDIIPDEGYRNKNTKYSWTQDRITVLSRKNASYPTIAIINPFTSSDTGGHFGLFVFDDIMTSDALNRPDNVSRSVKSIMNFITNTCFSSSNDVRGSSTAYRFVGTRYGDNDVYAQLIKRDFLTPRLRLCTDNGRWDGNPYLTSKDQFMERYKLIFNDPEIPPDENDIINLQLFQRPTRNQQVRTKLMDNPPLMRFTQYYDRTAEDYIHERERVRYVKDKSSQTMYIIVDPAMSIKETADHTAIIVVGVSSDNNFYVYEIQSGHFDLLGKWARLRELYKQYNVRTIYYEQQAAHNDVEFFTIQSARDGVYVHIETYTNRKMSKNSRILNFGDFAVSSGVLFFDYDLNFTDPKMKTRDGFQMMMKEWNTFSTQKTHNNDDILDALSMIPALDLQYTYIQTSVKSNTKNVENNYLDISPMDEVNDSNEKLFYALQRGSKI